MVQLGLLLRAEEKYQDALECFNKAIELDADYESAKRARRDILKLERIKKNIE